jgi:hypothetical protein
MFSTVQLLPSQLSATGAPLRSTQHRTFPTAVHASAEAHEIPLNVPLLAGEGVFSIVQLLPSQRSTTGCVTNGAGPVLVKTPAAEHASDEVHETALKPTVPPGGSVASWTDQPLPSKRATKPLPPTAMQAMGDAHETPVSAPTSLPGGVGV